MAPVTLPPSFYNSFWSPDYRSGLDVLFKQLEQGCLEDDHVANFVDSQARAHHTLALTLLSSAIASKSDADSSTSLQHTLLSLQDASISRGRAHQALADELEQRVLSGFKHWKQRHEERVKDAKNELLSKTGVIKAWEKEVQRLISLRQTYLVRTHHADDSEDDAKFAPASSPHLRSPISDTYTASPDPHKAALRRSGTVADRISEKIRAASVSSPASKTLSIDGKTLPAPPTPLRPSTPVNVTDSPTSPMREEAFTPPSSGPPPALPRKNTVIPSDTILLSGLSFTPSALKDLLHRLDAYLLTNPAPYSDISATQSTKSNAALASRQKTTILGSYEKTFSGEEVVEWLRQKVEGLGGDWDRCEETANELHRMGHFSRVGVGRGFDSSYDTHFTLNVIPSNTSIISSPLSPATSANIQSILQKYIPAGLGNNDEPVHVKMRKEALKADEAYKEGVRRAEERRLEMEERIERGLRSWEGWERERLGVIKAVLQSYEEAISKLPARLDGLIKPTRLSIETFSPEADVKALIEGNCTGPYRPHAHIYESTISDKPDVNFGIDLRKWSGDHGWGSLVGKAKGSIPEVLEGLLSGLREMYAGIMDEDRRRAWIYEVPLTDIHPLRHAINDSRLTTRDIINTVKKANVPIVAGTVKLYLLELNPPVLGWEGWEDAKAIYPAVGADQERDMTSAVNSVLERLPASHLFALDAVVKHLRELIDYTKSKESNDVYITKLAISVGRTILRPQYESELTIHDRTSSLFLADLINLYTSIFPALMERKKKEADRVMPVRKRTALVDQRISRSDLSPGADPAEVLEHQRAVKETGSATFTSGAMRAEPSSATSTSDGFGSASSLGFGEPYSHARPHEPAPASTSTPASAPLHAPPPVPAPVQTAREESVKLIPPTLEMINTSDGRLPEQEVPDDIVSSTASILESMKSNDEDSVLASTATAAGTAGLTRARSGEVSRLRGPRGTRGPRPAPGRVASQSRPESMAGNENEDVKGYGNGNGEAAPNEKPRAPMGLRTGGSVSAMAARFQGT